MKLKDIFRNNLTRLGHMAGAGRLINRGAMEGSTPNDSITNVFCTTMGLVTLTVGIPFMAAAYLADVGSNIKRKIASKESGPTPSA